VLLKQLFFAGVHPHGAAAALDAAVAAGNTSQGSSLQSSPGVTRGTASRPGTARNLRNSAGSEGLDAGGGGGDGDGLRGDALHTVMEEESGHLSEAEDEESHPPGAALVVTLRNLQLTLAPGSHVGIRARASCSKRQLCRVLQYTGNNNSNTPGTSAGVGATGAGPGAAHQQLGGAVTAASSTTTTAAPLFRCALPAALPAMPLTAAAATLILELWSVPGPPSSPPLRQPFPQQAVAGAEVQGDTTPQPSLVWALDPDVLDESQGCDLLGVAVVPLTLPVGSARATADGVFPIKDVLGSSGSAGDPVLGTVDVLASLERAVPLVRHTWRVTVCGAAGLPSAEEMEAAGLPAPSGRYARYYYPGGCCWAFSFKSAISTGCVVQQLFSLAWLGAWFYLQDSLTRVYDEGLHQHRGVYLHACNQPRYYYPGGWVLLLYWQNGYEVAVVQQCEVLSFR
jgi:hypothetical protein